MIMKPMGHHHLDLRKVHLLGSRRGFGPFINQLDEIMYRLTIHMDQLIYKSTSPDTNT